MAKPIFTVGVPIKEEPEVFKFINDSLVKGMQDYHVICYRSYTNNYVFEFFSESKIKTAKRKKLKES